ncbi:MAG: glycosyltransferase family 2 protein [Bacteroidota bacterium]
MRISIITVCFNAERTIERTIRSVLSQDHADVEYIVIDGGSTDRTPEIIQEYEQDIARFVSEKDEGIYFALNKGLSLASGEVIGQLHADDFYTDEKVLTKVSRLMEEKGAESLYADLQYVQADDASRVFRNWKAGEYREGIFLKGWMPPHPTFFLRKSCYEKYGGFNTLLRSAADYELMLRMLHKHHVSVVYLPEVIVKMRVGGRSNASLLNRIKANREDRLAWKLNGLKPGLFTLAFKPLSKLKQFF